MKEEDVESYLRGVASADGFSVSTGRRDDVPFVCFAGVGEPHRWAVVSTRGDFWVSVHVAGGLSWIELIEDFSDAEVVEVLDQATLIATTYVRSGGEVARVGRLKTRTMVITTPEGEYTLKTSLAADIANLFKRERDL